MTDSVYNTLVTLLLIGAAVIVFMLIFGHGFSFGSSTASATPLTQYSSQPASVVEVFRDRPIVEPAPTYAPVSSYDSSYYTSQTTYSYSCDGMGHCWTNQ